MGAVGQLTPDGRHADLPAPKQSFAWYANTKSIERSEILPNMATFIQARALAEEWVRIVSNGTARITEGATRARPYGWIFLYHSTSVQRAQFTC